MRPALRLGQGFGRLHRALVPQPCQGGLDQSKDHGHGAQQGVQQEQHPDVDRGPWQIEKGKNALENMIEVARESEHPRAYEVLSGMIKNISDVNDRLMVLNKGKKELDKKNETTEVNNTQNNFYLGSTADVQRLLKGDLIDVTRTGGESESDSGDVSR